LGVVENSGYFRWSESMRNGKCIFISALCVMSFAMMVGCPSGIVVPLPPVPVPLGESLGEFTLVANESQSAAGAVPSFDPGVTIVSGSITIDPSVISISPTESAKTRLAQTGPNTATITARIASADEVETVCASGEEYGPFTITFDDDFVIQSVSPETVTLSQNTVDLLNGGSFSLCIEAEMSVDGIITINELTLNISARIGG